MALPADADDQFRASKTAGYIAIKVSVPKTIQLDKEDFEAPGDGR